MNYFVNYSIVHRLEAESKWEEALAFWKLYDYTENRINVQAVEMIIEAKRLGDRFRELTAPFREKLENHFINIYQYNDELNKAHKIVYGY